MVELVPQQKEAVDLATTAVKRATPVFRIGGYAGTGKTTVSKFIHDAIPHGGCMAFCGKACDVLRKKGLPAQTIHSSIYDYDLALNAFFLKPKLDFDWIHLDEGSMVGSSLWDDLQSFGLPIIVTGDPGQLEPVNDDDPHLMRDPDFTLTQIHRQALNNPIIRLATQVREQDDDINWRRFQRTKNAIFKELDWPDVILCGYNKSRIAINNAVRLRRGFKNDDLYPGERIVCKQNDRELGVFNGMFFTVVDHMSGDKYRLKTDDGKIFVGDIAHVGFNQPKNELSFNEILKYRGKRLIADYGYCTTVHTFQGSETSKVAYIDEQAPNLWCQIRHRYTGITRAIDELRVYKEDDY